MASIFSKIIAGDIPCYKIAEDEAFFAFLDIHPVTKGHTLIVPKKEIDYLFDLDDETLGSMMIFAKKIAGAIRKALPCVRIGVSVIGLEVPHAHIHLIPIRKESDMRIGRTKEKLTPEEFQAIASAIQTQLSAL